MVTHVLCVTKFERLGDLGVGHIFIFSKSGWINFDLFECSITIFSRRTIWFWLFQFCDFCVLWLWMAPSCVAVGQLASQQGVVCVVCICGWWLIFLEVFFRWLVC